MDRLVDECISLPLVLLCRISRNASLLYVVQRHGMPSIPCSKGRLNVFLPQVVLPWGRPNRHWYTNRATAAARRSLMLIIADTRAQGHR